MERLGQRRFVHELRALIDRGRWEEARALAVEHPRAMRAAFVLEHVGRARARALSGRDDAALVRSSDA